MAAVVYHGLAVSDNEKILLAQGNREPFVGRWKFPWFPYSGGGALGIISSTVVVFKEKTGIDALVEGFLGVYETPWGKDSSLILLLFHGSYRGGQMQFNKDDFSDLRWFTPNEFNHLSDGQIYTPAVRAVFSQVTEHQVLPLNAVHLIDLLKGTLLG